MDPGRRAMIDGAGAASPPPPPSRSSQQQHEQPHRHHRGSKNRVSKPSRPGPPRAAAAAAAHYLTEEEQARKYVADEDMFVMKQSKKAADIRVREGRATPIDRLAFNLRYIDPGRDILEDEDADLDIALEDPANLLLLAATGGGGAEGANAGAGAQGANSLAQLTQLQKDIGHFHCLEKNAQLRQYWEACRELCAHHAEKLRASTQDGRVVNSVVDDIDRILGPKTYEQLAALEKQISAKLRSDEDIDTDYWQQLLRHLQVWQAKATLKRIFAGIQQKRADLLAARGGGEGEGGASTSPSTSASTPAAASARAAAAATTSSQNAANPSAAIQASRGAAASDNNRGGPLPATTTSSINATDVLYNREAAKGVLDNEEVFAAEEEVAPAKTPPGGHADDEHKARKKPRYFNRVQMGYEWNKYNQTHYDHDNPPPKVVHGYRFNIFYPDLVDKTKAPTFRIIREHGRRRGESLAAAGENDTCIIRFTAGPPYEDIAFRIVDKEWDYSAKRERGFKSSFEGGTLQLHFQFKKRSQCAGELSSSSGTVFSPGQRMSEQACGGFMRKQRLDSGSCVWIVASPAGLGWAGLAVAAVIAVITTTTGESQSCSRGAGQSRRIRGNAWFE
ncbi:Cactin protein, cactus-binding domain, C-terminal [Moelleriella libera RCEF 2490]|uniref:Splicing factor Cactin n=1 Tax=Moelleriella libera RCEF 2490 TaxID=1081109 RepID=A0A166U2Y8_9HYPO|nr:Cactin protein, cactus-binding domain, C-terminal [Moelleriella libera RCEF 2490]